MVYRRIAHREPRCSTMSAGLGFMCLADVGGRERGVTRYNMIITPTAQVDRYNCRA